MGFERVAVRACFGAFKNLSRRGKNGLRDNWYFLNLSSHFRRQISSIQAPLVISDCRNPSFAGAKRHLFREVSAGTREKSTPADWR